MIEGIEQRCRRVCNIRPGGQYGPVRWRMAGLLLQYIWKYSKRIILSRFNNGFCILRKDSIYMITPEYLKEGDKIGIVATARKISREELQPAISVFESWGLTVVLGKNLFNAEHQFSGTDQERLEDLQAMLDDPSVKAIISARGGYGTVRIIDQLNFDKFKAHPKWVIGFSDITVLHSHIHMQSQVETIHAVMPINFPKDSTINNPVDSLRKALFGSLTEYNMELPESLKPFQRKGSAEGQLVGGNLSLLYALSGSPSDLDTRDKILFIEDLDEYLYHIDRMMVQLDRSGKLQHLKGLIVGGMSGMKDNTIPFGKSAEEIIFDTVKKYPYPVCFGFPAGHIPENMALIFGRNIQLSVEERVSIRF